MTNQLLIHTYIQVYKSAHQVLDDKPTSPPRYIQVLDEKSAFPTYIQV